MIMRKEIIFNSIIGLTLSLLAASCNGSTNPNAPYQPDTTTSSARNRLPANINAGNLFALLLSPTQDQMELLDLVDNRVKLAVSTGRNPIELSVSPDKAHILVINQ